MIPLTLSLSTGVHFATALIKSAAFIVRSASFHSRVNAKTNLDRGNPQLPGAFKTDIRATGILQIFRPGVKVPVHLDAVLGWQPAVLHPRGGITHQIGGDGGE
jgi:hypothetical protein